MPETINTSFLGEASFSEEDATPNETMIKVDDVSMVFNMASETMSNLKEYAIALARRELRFKEFRALDHVSLEVKKGDVFGILGTNGSGKSTLLKIIAGVLEPTEGTCTVNGSIAPLIELGAGFDMELTARENIYLNGALLGYSKKFIEEHFDEIVDFAEIENFLDMPLKNYSSGMVARIAFAIATVIVPEILIVDEVLSVGDFMFQQKCERRIQSLIKEHGVTVLIVSHDNHLIERLCNKAVWIEKGHLRTIGKAESICQIYQLLGGRIGSSRAEKEIFDIYKKNIQIDEHRASTLTGHDRFSTAARITDATPFPKKPTIGIITPIDHPNISLLAGSMASTMNAVIIPTLENDFPDSSIPTLEKLNLQLLYVLGDSSLVSDYSINKIEHAINCPSQRILGSNEIELSLAVGQMSGGLAPTKDRKTTAVVAQQKANLPLIVFSPYFYQERCKLFFATTDEDEKAKLIEQLSEANYKEVVVLSDSTFYKDCYKDLLQSLGHKTTLLELNDDPWKTNAIINQWIVSRCELTYKNLVVINGAIPDDGYYIGQYAGLTNALTWLMDPNNLDNVLDSYQNIRRNNVDSLTFLGGSLFSKTDKEILLKAIAMHESEN